MSRRRLVSTTQAIYATFHNADTENAASDVIVPVNKTRAAIHESHDGYYEDKESKDDTPLHDSPITTSQYGSINGGATDGDTDEDTNTPQIKKKKRQKKVTASDVLGSKRNFDGEIAWRSLAIMFNAMSGVALMITVLQVCWDGEEYKPTRTGNILKWVITGTTVILIWQIIERRKFQMEIKMREKSRKFSATDQHGVSIAEVLSLSADEFRWKTWAQLLVCAFHPLPSIQMVGYEYFPDEVGLLMFFRLYTVFRVVRDYSAIWTHRRLIRKSVDASNAPSFDWWLALKTMAFRAPLVFYVTWVVLFVCLFGYCLYILEREGQPDIFSFGTGAFLAAQCILTGWASDTYDVYDPQTWAGRITCILSTVIGLFIVSFLIGVVSHEFVPSGFEYNALNWLLHKRILDKEKNAAASLIQLAFRNYRRDNALWEELEEKDPDLYERVSETEEKLFMQRFLRKSKVVKSYRRQRMELEDEMDPTSKQNMSVLDRHFDQKLDRLMNNFHVMQTHHESAIRRMEGLLALHLSKSKPQATHATLSGGSGAGAGNSMSMAPFGHQLTPLAVNTAIGSGNYQASGSSTASPHHAITNMAAVPAPPTIAGGGPPLVHSSTWTALPLGHPNPNRTQSLPEVPLALIAGADRERTISGSTVVAQHQLHHTSAASMMPPPPPPPPPPQSSMLLPAGHVYTPRDRHQSSSGLIHAGSGSSNSSGSPATTGPGGAPVNSRSASPSSSSGGSPLVTIASSGMVHTSAAGTPVAMGDRVGLLSRPPSMTPIPPSTAATATPAAEMRSPNIVQPGGSINGDANAKR